MNGPGDEIVLMTVLPITIVFWAWVVWVILEWRKMRHNLYYIVRQWVHEYLLYGIDGLGFIYIRSSLYPCHFYFG